MDVGARTYQIRAWGGHIRSHRGTETTEISIENSLYGETLCCSPRPLSSAATYVISIAA
jgi:hypothetical protein